MKMQQNQVHFLKLIRTGNTTDTNIIHFTHCSSLQRPKSWNKLENFNQQAPCRTSHIDVSFKARLQHPKSSILNIILSDWLTWLNWFLLSALLFHIFIDHSVMIEWGIGKCWMFNVMWNESTIYSSVSSAFKCNFKI